MAVLTFRYNVASVLISWTFILILFLLLIQLRLRPFRPAARPAGLRLQPRAEAALHYRHHAVEIGINFLYLTEHGHHGRFTDVAAIAGDIGGLAGGQDWRKASSCS